MATKKNHAKIEIETFTLSQLKDHPENPRVHPAPGTEAWNALRNSIANVYFDPLVVNVRNRTLVSGHLRKKIMLELGIDRADCVVIDVDEITHKSLLMRANRNDGVFDNDAVVKLLQEMDGKIDLNMSGFNGEDLAELVQKFSNLPPPTTPFSEFDQSAINADGSVNFNFGSFRTKVRKDVYDKFSKHVMKKQGKDGGVLLDDIIADLL